MKTLNLINLNQSIKALMSQQLVTVQPNTMVTEVAEIFDNNKFHHLPVIDSEEKPVGIISKNDYHKLQHHFTLFQYKEASRSNEKLFETLIAEEIMTKEPICIGSGTTIRECLKMFISNEFHCLIVVEKGKMVGIITPFDFIKFLNENY